MSAVSTFPATGVLPADEEEQLANAIVVTLEGCETLESLVGTCPTDFTRACETVTWALYDRVWGDEHPGIREWITLHAWGEAYGPDGPLDENGGE